ncbi:glycosyltransferase family 25 protein [Falsiroseomonas sp.]|uniref:glycosyltransferase family 25 protein n=1 Tax=Falsiroseomonas sp. TaxID=2870721 RepID=UPI0035684BB6
MSGVPVFVISLSRATKRRASIAAHLSNLGIDAEFADAVDGELLSPDERRAIQAAGTDFHPGVVGCYLSHMAVYRRIVAKGLPVALVLEDDARLNPRFARLLRSAPHKLDFDYCFLDCDNRNPDGAVYYNHADGIEVLPGYTAYATHGGPATLHAYLITAKAAATRLEHEFPITQPVDVYSTLPYRPLFRAIVSPRAAGVGEESMRSFTSVRDHYGQLQLRWLRRMPGFYELRSALSGELRALRDQVPELVRQGRLPAGGDWRPLPAGRRIFI